MFRELPIATDRSIQYGVISSHRNVRRGSPASTGTSGPMGLLLLLLLPLLLMLLLGAFVVPSISTNVGMTQPFWRELATAPGKYTEKHR